MIPSTSAYARNLKSYYLTRFIVAAAWAIAAALTPLNVPLLAGLLLVAYPLWDAVANLVDAQQSGGLLANPSQAINLAVSLLAGTAVIFALTTSMNNVVLVYGLWAALAGLMQLATGVRRWRGFSAQWPMILSGAQSTLAGVFFIKRAGDAMPKSIHDLAPYAAFGAFYFLISFIGSVWGERSRRTAGQTGAV